METPRPSTIVEFAALKPGPHREPLSKARIVAGISSFTMLLIQIFWLRPDFISGSPLNSLLAMLVFCMLVLYYWFAGGLSLGREINWELVGECQPSSAARTPLRVTKLREIALPYACRRSLQLVFPGERDCYIVVCRRTGGLAFTDITVLYLPDKRSDGIGIVARLQHGYFTLHSGVYDSELYLFVVPKSFMRWTKIKKQHCIHAFRAGRHAWTRHVSQDLGLGKTLPKLAGLTPSKSGTPFLFLYAYPQVVFVNGLDGSPCSKEDFQDWSGVQWRENESWQCLRGFHAVDETWGTLIEPASSSSSAASSRLAMKPLFAGMPLDVIKTDGQRLHFQPPFFRVALEREFMSLDKGPFEIVLQPNLSTRGQFARGLVWGYDQSKTVFKSSSYCMRNVAWRTKSRLGLLVHVVPRETLMGVLPPFRWLFAREALLFFWDPSTHLFTTSPIRVSRRGCDLAWWGDDLALATSGVLTLYTVEEVNS